MFFVFLNASKIETITPLHSDLFKSKRDLEYFEFIRKICPYRSEESISFGVFKRKFKERFNISIEKVKSIIKPFIEDEILQIGYNDGVQLNLLANKTRNDIFSLILKYPGIYINLIRTFLKLGPHQTIWHLKFLLEFDYINEYKITNVKAYSEPSVHFYQVLLGFIICKNSIRQLLKVIYNHPEGIPISQIQDLLNKPRSSLFYMLKSLIKLNVIIKAGFSNDLYKLQLNYFSVFQSTLENYHKIFSF